MISGSSTMSPYDVYKNWEADYSRNPSRYKSHVRKEALQVLCDYFIYHNFSIKDLKVFRGNVIEFLVSKNARHRKGKHADGKWLADVELDFDQIVASNFVKLKMLDPQYGPEYSQYRKEIADWVKTKFKTDNPKLIKEAHRIGGQIYIDFVQDTCYLK